MSDTPSNLVPFPEQQPDDFEPLELPEDVVFRLRQASFRTGIPEEELLHQCLSIFIDYYEEHGHIPFMVVEEPNSNEPNAS